MHIHGFSELLSGITTCLYLLLEPNSCAKNCFINGIKSTALPAYFAEVHITPAELPRAPQIASEAGGRSSLQTGAGAAFPVQPWVPARAMSSSWQRPNELSPFPLTPESGELEAHLKMTSLVHDVCVWPVG